MKNLVENWKQVALIGYSAWALYAIAIIVVAPDLIFWIFGIDTNPRVWSGLLIMAVILGFIGRLIEQPKASALRRRIIIGVILAITFVVSFPAMASPCTHFDKRFDDAAFTLISKWEGKRNAAYQDIVGVWTICYGHTETAGPGKYMRDAECYNLLISEIGEYREGLHVYFTAETKRSRLPYLRDAAFTSLAYNVGVRGAGLSTATRRLNKGDIPGGCQALTWWNKAGGRVVRGLSRRRAEEREYCLKGQ